MNATARPFRIRRAGLEDAGLLGALEARAQREDQDGAAAIERAGPIDPHSIARRWRAEMRRERARPSDASAFVLCDGDAPAGFAQAGPQRFKRHEHRYPAEIFAIRVFEPYRGRGGGRILLQSAAQALAARGLFSFSLWTDAADVGARAFVEHMGGVLGDRRWVRRDGRRIAQVAYLWADLLALRNGAAD